MPTSIHIPRPLLDEVDRRARRLKMSRNRFIVRALEKEVSHERQWSPRFFEALAEVTPDDASAVDEMARSLAKHRTRKGPPKL